MFPKQTKRILIVALIVYALALAVSAKNADAQTVIGRCPQYEALLKEYKLPVAEFSAIMYRESRCQPKAIGWNYHKGMSHRDCKLSPAVTYRRCKAVKSYDNGLLQINSSWVTVTAQVCKAKRGDLSVLLIPRCNVAVAQYLYAEGGGIGNWRATSGRGSNG